MTSRLALMAEQRSDTRLVIDGGRSLLHCITNIVEYTSRRLFAASNFTIYDQENEVYECHLHFLISVTFSVGMFAVL